MGQKIKKYYASHTAGELDPALHGRVDTAQYFYGCEKARNVFILPQGGFIRRPGLRHVANAPIPDPAIDERCRMIPFQSSASSGGYVVAIGFDDIFIYSEAGVLKDSILGTGLGLGVQQITWTQTQDSLILFYGGFLRPQRLRRISDTNWTLTEIPLRAIPQYSFEDTAGAPTSHVERILLINFAVNDQFTLFINDTETAPIPWTNVPAADNAAIKAAIEALEFIAPGDITVALTAAANNQFDITFGGTVDGIRFFVTPGDANVINLDNNNLVTVHTVVKGSGPKEDIWNSDIFGTFRGWPRCGVFFQNRLWMAGSVALPNFVWASRVGDAEDFVLVDDPTDDSPIQYQVDLESGVEFINAFVGRHLQLYANNAELYVPISEDEPITALNIVIRSTTSIGTMYGAPIYALGGASLFLQKNGRSLRALMFIDTELAYRAPSLTKYAGHLLDVELVNEFDNSILRDVPISSWAVRKSNGPNEPDTIYIVNESGHLVVISLDQDENVIASQQWETNGLFVDVCVVNQQVFVIVLRENGSRRNIYIEVFDDRLLLDCATIVEGIGAPVTQSSDLTYFDPLIGFLPPTLLAVEGIVDGISQGIQNFSDVDTIYNFSPSAEDSWQVGLPFPDVKGDSSQIWVRTLPLEVENSGEPLIGDNKSPVEVIVRVLDTGELKVAGEKVPLLTWPEGGDPNILTKSGDFTVEGLQDTDERGQIDITQSQSRPMQVLSYAVRVVVQGEG